MKWTDQEWSREQLLNDPELLDRVLRDWHALRDLVRNSPIRFAVYDADDQLILWNKLYELNHLEAFEQRQSELEAGTLTYRELLRYQLAATLAEDDLE